MITKKELEKIAHKEIENPSVLPTPNQLKKLVPVKEMGIKTPIIGKSVIREILNGNDDRLLLIVGPCSIHDPEAALEYAWRLNKLRKAVEDKIVIVMRTYFEKPRSTVGWKGLLYDPDLDGSNDMVKGLITARKLLVAINEMGMPCATEILDPLILPYIGDLLSYVSIGARTSESQIHRQAISGVDIPAGIKNSTDGNITNAINAIVSISEGHNMISVSQDGNVVMAQTEGNDSAHVILRGGSDGPNYSSESINRASILGEKSMVNSSVIVDCSHQNSQKKYKRQLMVANEIIENWKKGITSGLKGIMLESNLNEGNQIINKNKLKYGISITDECLNWEDTEKLICNIYNR